MQETIICHENLYTGAHHLTKNVFRKANTEHL